MKYLVIGGGAIGGSIAAYLTKAEKEVTLIARGRQLEEISEYGLFVSKGRNEFNAKINTVSAEEYDDNPDVIFLCVKGYSLESTYPIIKSCAVKNTVIIPLLNGYGINEKISKEFPDLTVLAGCIYIAASVTEPGFIHLSSDIFKIVYGFLDGNLKDQRLLEVASDLAKSGITPIYSDNIKAGYFQEVYNGISDGCCRNLLQRNRSRIQTRFPGKRYVYKMRRGTGQSGCRNGNRHS